MIVTAFHCLSQWILEHSYLLQDKQCLYTVLEVVELGISGKRSHQVSDSTYFFLLLHPRPYLITLLNGPP